MQIGPIYGRGTPNSLFYRSFFHVRGRVHRPATAALEPAPDRFLAPLLVLCYRYRVLVFVGYGDGATLRTGRFVAKQIGIYQGDGGDLIKVVDLSTPVPGCDGEFRVGRISRAASA